MRSLTEITCPTISEAVKFRTNPSAPEAQKAQRTAQPTCVLTHTVMPVLRLIHTVSILFPSVNSKGILLYYSLYRFSIFLNSYLFSYMRIERHRRRSLHLNSS